MDKEVYQCRHEKTVQDAQNGEVICSNCYRILDKNCQQAGSAHNLYPLSSFSMGLASTITARAVDYSGRRVRVQTMTQLLDSSRKAKASTALSKNKYRGTLELQRMCTLLQLPQGIQEKARSTFLEFAQKGYLKGKHLYSCLYGILVITACQQEYPLTLKEILRHTTVSRKRINSDFYTVFQLYEHTPQTAISASTHIKQLINRIDDGWEHYNQFEQKLGALLQTIEYRTHHGRNALVMGVIAVYVLLRHYNYPKREDFLRRANLSRSTLLNKLSQLANKYPEVEYFK